MHHPVPNCSSRAVLQRRRACAEQAGDEAISRRAGERGPAARRACWRSRGFRRFVASTGRGAVVAKAAAAAFARGDGRRIRKTLDHTPHGGRPRTRTARLIRKRREAQRHRRSGERQQPQRRAPAQAVAGPARDAQHRPMDRPAQAARRAHSRSPRSTRTCRAGAPNDAATSRAKSAACSRPRSLAIRIMICPPRLSSGRGARDELVAVLQHAFAQDHEAGVEAFDQRQVKFARHLNQPVGFEREDVAGAAREPARIACRLLRHQKRPPAVGNDLLQGGER